MNNYQVIITLGGTGKRFSDAGYVLPKYMLPADIHNPNYKVIDLVSDMYQGMTKIYLCNESHIDKYNLNEILDDGNSIIVPVKPGEGPGNVIYQAKRYISNSAKTFVQYCDTFQPWDIEEIKSMLEDKNPDAAVVVTDEQCPSVFDGTLYGRVKVIDNKVVNIQEKAPAGYSDYLGCGTFYFRSGSHLLKYINLQENRRDLYYLNGESYINCTIKAMLDDNQYVFPINVKNYLNLGVPRDYEEYMYWQRTESKLNSGSLIHTVKDSTLIMPAAGLGSRFKGSYKEPKPLIPMLSGNRMYQDAIRYSFPTEKTVVVTRKDLDFYEEFKETASDCEFIGLEKITEGQAITVREGLSKAGDGPVVINSCDQGILYDHSKFKEIYKDADIVICGLKNYSPAIAKPTSFSWVNVSGSDVLEITSKRCDGDPKNGLVFISCLIYKNKEILENSIESLLERGKTTNGEYYIDESLNDSINLGYRVKLLEIDSYINWGTPEELAMFNWWINFFNTIKNEYLA